MKIQYETLGRYSDIYCYPGKEENIRLGRLQSNLWVARMEIYLSQGETKYLQSSAVQTFNTNSGSVPVTHNAMNGLFSLDLQ